MLASLVVVVLGASAPGCVLPELIVDDGDSTGGGASDQIGGNHSGGDSSDTGGQGTGSTSTGGGNTGGDSSGGGGSPTGGGGGGGSGGDGSGGDGSGATSSGGDGSGGDGSGGGGFVCNLPALPDPSALTEVNMKLPDPFTFFNGTPVTTHEEWDCRRREILAMADKYLYGPVPPAPDDVSGTVTGTSVNINVTVGTDTETFAATIGSGASDVIALKLTGGIFPSDSKALTFGSGFEAKIESLFGLSGMSTHIANGWMLDRVLDVLEQNPSSGYDPTKVMVSGCSGCGKAAFLTGVFSRAPLVVIVESGGGGTGSLRQIEWFRHGDGEPLYDCTTLPQGIDNLEENGICGPWRTDASDWLAVDPTKVYNLPIDQHLLLATIAPRHLLVFTNSNGPEEWCSLGGTCEALSAWAAKSVFGALGVPENMGFQQYDAGHCSTPTEAVALADQFFARAFEGDTGATTDVFELLPDTDGPRIQQPVSEWSTMWVDWNRSTVLTP